MPSGLGLLAGLGSVFALVATYWDDSWHTDKGRDWTDAKIRVHVFCVLR